MEGELNKNAENKDAGLLSTVESLYPVLDFFLGLNDKLKAIFEADPELAKATYHSVNELGTEATQEHVKIDTQKLAESISFGDKAFLLLNEFFGESFFKIDKAFTFQSLEEATATYERINLKPHAFPLKKFEGVPHLLMPTNFFDPTSLFNTALALKDSPEAFPIPSGARLVLDQRVSPFAVNALQKAATAAGKKISVWTPSELDGIPKPSEAECQIVLTPDLETFKKTIDWEQVTMFSQLWKNDAVPALGWSPELVAAVQLDLGKTPEEACKMAGLEEPDPTFFAQLKAKFAEKIPEEDISDPDDLDESL